MSAQAPARVEICPDDMLAITLLVSEAMRIVISNCSDPETEALPELHQIAEEIGSRTMLRTSKAPTPQPSAPDSGLTATKLIANLSKKSLGWLCGKREDPIDEKPKPNKGRENGSSVYTRLTLGGYGATAKRNTSPSISTPPTSGHVSTLPSLVSLDDNKAHASSSGYQRTISTEVRKAKYTVGEDGKEARVGDEKVKRCIITEEVGPLQPIPSNQTANNQAENSPNNQAENSPNNQKIVAEPPKLQDNKKSS